MLAKALSAYSPTNSGTVTDLPCFVYIFKEKFTIITIIITRAIAASTLKINNLLFKKFKNLFLPLAFFIQKILGCKNIKNL